MSLSLRLSMSSSADSDGPVAVMRTPSPALNRSSSDELVAGMARLFRTPTPQDTTQPPRQIVLLPAPTAVAPIAACASSSSAVVDPFGIASPKVTDPSTRDYGNLLKLIDSCDPYRGHLQKAWEDCSVAKNYVNMQKNRYSNVIPTDASRICLSCRNSFDTDYINACTFQGMILTQGPLESTISDFWIMLFEQNIQSVACLAGFREVNLRTSALEEKTYPYWNPTLRDDTSQSLKKGHVLFSRIIYQESDEIPLTVTLVEEPQVVLGAGEQNNEHVIKQTFAITLGSTTKIVTHFHYRNWKDHFGADSRILVEFVKVLRRQGGPIALLCSAGVGRTGTCACLVHLIDKYMQSKSSGAIIPTEADVLTEVVALRSVRLGGCVTSPVQLQVLFEALAIFILQDQQTP